MLKRARVIYRGRVQGVGFRYTARRLAQGYAIDGFVKNRTDGSVELVAQGGEGEIDRFLADLEQTMGSLIRSRTLTWEPASKDLDGFSVRF